MGEMKHRWLSRSLRRVTLVTLGLMSLAWVADSCLDAYFEGASLQEEIFAPSLHEIAIRGLFLGVQFLFVLYIVRILRRQEKMASDLEEALSQAEIEKNKSEAVLEALGDGISIQDLELKILYQNRAHRAMVGDHLGEYCYQAYQGREAVCPECALRRAFLDGRAHRGESRTGDAHGSRQVEIHSTPLRDKDGRIIAGIEAVRDVTERWEMEEVIRRMNRDLEHQASELSVANQELEAFGYSLTHDLRSHLTRVYSAAQALEEFQTPALDSQGQFLVRNICEGCEGMEALIEAMLTLAQVPRGQLHREPIDLGQLAGEIAAELAALEPERRVDYRIAPALLAEGDPELLRLALENILSNAWKYTRERNPGCVEVGTTDQAGRKVYFVRDNGTGFDMREVDRLFRPFQRLSSAKRFPGTGIGLATVKRIIHYHGGEVWAEGEPDAGASIFFTLPETPPAKS